VLDDRQVKVGVHLLVQLAIAGFSTCFFLDNDEIAHQSHWLAFFIGDVGSRLPRQPVSGLIDIDNIVDLECWRLCVRRIRSVLGEVQERIAYSATALVGAACDALNSGWTSRRSELQVLCEDS
jgi:hypothetical protein